MDWRGVEPLTANCSRQANEREDMSECRGCINIALRTDGAGGGSGWSGRVEGLGGGGWRRGIGGWGGKHILPHL